MKTVKIEVSEKIKTKPIEGTYKGKVVRWGNGAGIQFYKKFIGKTVLILLQNEDE